MKIGIDIDDTICQTSESVNKWAKKYAKDNNTTVANIFMTHEERYKFLRKHYYDILTDALVKEDFIKVIDELSKKNKIYFITARNNNYLDDDLDVNEITKNWLKKNNIKYDGYYSDVYMEDKVKIIKNNNIDIMIDDDYRNYMAFKKNNIKTFLYDDKNMYADIIDSRKSWEEILSEI